MRSFARALAVLTIGAGMAGCGSAGGRAPGQFVFVSEAAGSNVSQLFVADADGTGVHKLTFSGAAEVDPKWSPDGGKVAFSREVACAAALGDCFELWTVNADGTGERRLTSAAPAHRTGPFTSLEPTWSPDGKQIAYVQTDEKSGGSSLHVMEAGGDNNRRLLGDVTAPAWSPDGTRIAFCRGGYLEDDIFLLNLEDGQVQRLTQTAVAECKPDWSPDGERLAYERVDGTVAGPSVQYDVFVMNADGTNTINLSRSNALDANPAWSSDGKQVAFGSDRNGDADPEIYVADANGVGPPRRVVGPTLAEYAVDWAPSR